MNSIAGKHLNKHQRRQHQDGVGRLCLKPAPLRLNFFPYSDASSVSSTSWSNRVCGSRSLAIALASSQPLPPISRPAAGSRVDHWAAVTDSEKSGQALEVKVKSINTGGLLISYQDEIKGFLPFSQVASNVKSSSSPTDLSYLVGQTIRVKIVSVSATGGRKEFVASEKKVAQSEALLKIKLGATMKAVVTTVEDYGVFVELVDIPRVTGLVHKSELSWDSVVSVDSLVQKGQVILVKVIDLEANSGRLGLSLKQTQPDPIKQTLETLEWGPVKDIPSEIQGLVDRIKAQEGVEDVYLGRQAVESKISSQELVVYLTKDVNAMASISDDVGFDAVARVGNVLQELHVVSAVGRVEARSMLARAVR